MRRQLLKRRPAARGGAAVVETAIVFPLLLLMMFGIIQIGYFQYVRHLMMEACRRGCRAMVVIGKQTYAQTVGQQTATSYLSQHFLNSAIFTVTATPAPTTSTTGNFWDVLDRVQISTTIGQALQFPITGITDPPITVRYLMVHEGNLPVP